MLNIHFSDQLAFSVARPSSYKKGKEYFAEGRVKKIWREGNEYKAAVKGNHLYRVSLKFAGEELVYNCSCPFELDGACKHVAAAILAFAADEKFSSVEKETEKSEAELKKLLAKISAVQQKNFLERILQKEPRLVEDLKIFLRGRRQTPVTITDYRNRFKDRLDELDTRELMEMWYLEGEDYYDGGYRDFYTQPLDEVVDEFIEPAEKYIENQNHAEALKIFQAAFGALLEKQQSLKGDAVDLSDWFGQEMDRVIESHAKILAQIKDKELKKIGIGFLASVFEQPSIYVDKRQLLDCFKQIIAARDEAVFALGCLKSRAKSSLSVEESSLLAWLFSAAGDWLAFEALCLKNLKVNPGLTPDLLRFYQKNNRKDKILETAESVLTRLMRKNDDHFFFAGEFDSREIEISIRRLLKEVYSAKEDYRAAVANLQRLFLTTGLLADYKELIRIYRQPAEKENFWQTIKKHFNDESKAEKAFKVFEFENQKREILELLTKYPQAECFPEMIKSVRRDFPGECFSAYKRKIENLLSETDVKKYAAAARHLRAMAGIGLNREFADFVSWIKTAYCRRRRLLEELRGI